MRREIKNALLNLKIKQIRKRVRVYFGYGYLIAYVWIGFAIFALIENDANVVLWAVVPWVLSIFFYSKTIKSRKSLASLKYNGIQPDLEAMLKYSNQLERRCQDFLYKVKTVILLSDFEKDLTTTTEGQIMVICLFSYMFGLFMYVRNFSAENEVYKGIGVFLTSFGIVVFLSLCLLYFKFIKVASEFLVRYHISSFAEKNRNHARNMLASLGAYQDPNVHLNKEAVKQVSAELSKFDEGLAEIENSLKGHRRLITISIASLLGYIASVITFLYNIYPQFQNGTLQILSVYSGLIAVALLASLWVFLMTPLSRERHMLTAFKIIEKEEKITEDIRNMMNSLLGKELGEIASESLHVAG